MSGATCFLECPPLLYTTMLAWYVSGRFHCYSRLTLNNSATAGVVLSGNETAYGCPDEAEKDNFYEMNY